MQYNLVELMTETTFGRFIFEKRKLAGMTQQALADAAEISKSYVSTIENQRPHSVTGAISQPERPIVLAIVEALNKNLSFSEKINIDEALNLAGYAAPNVAPGHFKGYDKLSPEKKRIADKQIAAIIDALIEEDTDNFDYISDETQ